MNLKSKIILLSSLAFTVLIASAIIFQEYRSTNYKLYQTASSLEKINHAGHEIAIEILLNLGDVDSLKGHLATVPLMTQQLQEIMPNANKPAELINMEISFVRVKRVIDNLKTGQSINRPLLEQVRNEVKKINNNVATLKNLSEQEIKRLQRRAELSITALYIILVVYIIGVFLILFKTVIRPILTLSNQIEKIREGELENITPLSRNDEIGQLSDAFNLLIDKRTQAEDALKEEIELHKQALDEVKTLSGLIPICASCKKIRDDKGYWSQIETYIEKHSSAQFSHAMCIECTDKLYGGQDWYEKAKNDGRLTVPEFIPESPDT